MESNVLRFRLGTPARWSPKTADIAWAAGIYEGEGTCVLQGAAGTTNGKNVAARVIQKRPWLCFKLKTFFGGRVRRAGKDRLYYEWCVTGARARGFLMTVFSFLSPHRREQIRSRLWPI